MTRSSGTHPLTALRRALRQRKLDGYVLRTSDRFLNEYVPPEDATRAWLTGFTGSMGDAVITAKAATLLVDGRYWVQAESEVDSAHWQVYRVPHGKTLEDGLSAVLSGAASPSRQREIRVGYPADRLGLDVLRHLERTVPDVEWVAEKCCPVEALMRAEEGTPDPALALSRERLRLLPEASFGTTAADKRRALMKELAPHEVGGMLVQRLDDIAYLTNARASGVPYQSSFRAIALVSAGETIVGLEGFTEHQALVAKQRPGVRWTDLEGFWRALEGKRKGDRIAVDEAHNTVGASLRLDDMGLCPVRVTSPLPLMKARKSPAEMKAIRRALRRADQVVDAAVRWLCQAVTQGKKVSEKDFADRVEDLFMQAGAHGLSFPVIAAAGKNGAIIHYSHPSPRRRLKVGDVMLLDTGAYFDEGYATDLTRTFLVGGASVRARDEDRHRFTTVLRGAIAGMRAVLPEGATGGQLDALVRGPIWAEGADFAHGTGHGVGINVHESPLSVRPHSRQPIEEGIVFSIEPGIYVPGRGGVRIENLCTAKRVRGRSSFLKVEPLTFAPIDRRLIDTKRLSPDEKSWLRAYQNKAPPRRTFR